MSVKSISFPNQALLGKISDGSSIPAQDAVRGVAAFSVVVAHTFGTRQLGPMAVAVFFVLSGFLISWLLIGES